MNEAVISGLVMGATLGIAGLVATVIWKVIRSIRASSEASRRVKLLVLWTFALMYVGFGISEPAFIPLLAFFAALVGAVYWVRSGMKK
jgi:chromate transport protein ChrA